MLRNAMLTKLGCTLLVLSAGAMACSDDKIIESIGETAAPAAGTAGSVTSPNAGAGAAASATTTHPAVDAGTSAAGSGAAGNAGRAGATAAGSDGATAGSGTAGMSAGSSGASGTASMTAAAGASGSGQAGSGAPPALAPIAAPVADDCIDDVTAGDHAYMCQGMKFLVMVDEQCTKNACGLIFDVHGAAMTAEIQREDTQLHMLAPPKGFLTVHPNSNGATWDLTKDPQTIADFMTRMIKAFHVDEKRVHFTGFSMGSAMTFWFLCNHRDALASAAPVTGASAEQVTVVENGLPCIASIDANWKPRVPILFMSGAMDGALTIDKARERTEGIVMRLGLTGGDQVDGDSTFTRKRWTGSDGMVFDFLEHNYSNAGLAGHCIPGGPSANFIACTAGGDSLHWGKTVLQWMVDHPKP